MYPPVSSVGPIGDSGRWGTTRGAIRYGRWRVPGATSLHELKLDSGRFGKGPMEARYDGVLVGTFPKPNRSRVTVATILGTFDGVELGVYAESRDNGQSVFADVFVNGRSLISGETADAVASRTVQAAAASSEQARIGCLSQAVALVWITPVIMLVSGLRNIHTDNPLIAAVIALIGSGVATWLAYLLMTRGLKRPSLTRGQAITLAIVGYGIAYLGSMIGLFVAIWVAGVNY